MGERGRAGRARRPDEIEAWWALISRILAFGLGAVLALTQNSTAAAAEDTLTRVAILALAASLMGPMVAASMAQVLAAFRNGRGRDE